MKSPDEINLAQACRTFAVANTPLFLLRKLRSDPAISEIARRFSADEILDAIRDAVERDPAELLHAVRPYAYVVALSKKPQDKELREASRISAPKWGWFSFIASVLIDSFSSVSVQQIQIPVFTQSPSYSIRSNEPVKIFILPGE
jgi:hypothetical protein